MVKMPEHDGFQVLFGSQERPVPGYPRTSYVSIRVLGTTARVIKLFVGTVVSY